MTTVNFRGRHTCECVAISLPLVEQEMIARGVIKSNIDIWQAGYNTGVAASAGTHNGGGATDVAQYSDEALRIWRDWGWTQQHRTRAQGFTPHGHGWPKGCPHLSSSARYQASEWEAGRNGLRGAGPITGPGPKGKDTPTWRQAIKNHAPTEPTKPPEDEGIFGMTKAIYQRRTQGITAKPTGDYKQLRVNDDDDFSIAVGPCKLTATSKVAVFGLKPGETIDFAHQTVSFKKGTPTKVRRTRHFVRLAGDGTPGAATIVVPVSLTLGKMPDGQTSRLRLAYRTDSETVTIGDIQTEGWRS